MIDDAKSEAHFGEPDPESIDKEWDEFANLVEKRKKRQESAFYPCPAPEDDYVNTLVRKSIRKLTFLE